MCLNHLTLQQLSQRWFHLVVMQPSESDGKGANLDLCGVSDVFFLFNNTSQRYKASAVTQ